MFKGIQHHNRQWQRIVSLNDSVTANKWNELIQKIR